MSKPELIRRATTTFAALLLAGSALATAPAASAAGTSPAVRPAHSVPVQPRGKVVSRLPLSIREEPTSRSRKLGSVPPGAVVALACKRHGQNVDGNDLWYLLGDGRRGYVAARYVKNLSAVPLCRR